jgi:hypothetical protein
MDKNRRISRREENLTDSEFRIPNSEFNMSLVTSAATKALELFDPLVAAR